MIPLEWKWAKYFFNSDIFAQVNAIFAMNSKVSQEAFEIALTTIGFLNKESSSY